MFDLERQKNNYKDHVATFTDYGNIKVLDFKKPGSSHYRIRFLFEEDYCRLHISGDLGKLISLEEHFSHEKTSSERTTSVGITDKEKIENHGFDVRTSFRG